MTFHWYIEDKCMINFIAGKASLCMWHKMLSEFCLYTIHIIQVSVAKLIIIKFFNIKRFYY